MRILKNLSSQLTVLQAKNLEIIWKKVEVSNHIKAMDLKLYQVDINLTIPNAKQAAHSNLNANIVNNLDGILLLFPVN